MPHLTDKLVKSLKPPASKSQIRVVDDEIVGFGIRVTRSGTKTFFLNYTVHTPKGRGRERRCSIGQYPAWSVARARERARALRRDVDLGVDPLAARDEIAAQPTFEEVWSIYARDVLPSKAEKTSRDQKALARRFLLPEFKGRKIGGITFRDVELLHLRVSKETPVQANRLLALARHIFTKAERWGYIKGNPAKGVNANHEEPRHRYLSDAERIRFHEALEKAEPTFSILAVKLLMLTGARKSEVLKAKWDQFDLENGFWTKPSSHTKQRREHRVPLSKAAIGVLRLAQSRRVNEYVFLGPDKRPLQDIRRAFNKICETAGIEGFRPHDMRHTFASVLTKSGTDLFRVGKLLGHTQPSTTMRYVHLEAEALREHAELASTG